MAAIVAEGGDLPFFFCLCCLFFFFLPLSLLALLTEALKDSCQDLIVVHNYGFWEDTDRDFTFYVDSTVYLALSKMSDK